MIDYHIHLERGSFNREWLAKFVETGKARAIEEFGIVEHLYLFKEASHLLYQNDHVIKKQNESIYDYLDFLAKAKEEFNLKIGLEVDYIESRESEIRDFAANFDVDFLIGSVHYLGEWAFDLSKNWPRNDYEAIYIEYYKTLLKLARSNIFDVLGHPGNIAYFGYGPSKEVEDRIVKNFYEELAKENIVLEINAGGLYRPAKRIFPEKKWFKTIKELNIDITVSSDAHDPDDVGYEINNEVIPALQGAGFTHLIGFEKRNKQFKPIKVHK